MGQGPPSITLRGEGSGECLNIGHREESILFDDKEFDTLIVACIELILNYERQEKILSLQNVDSVTAM